MSQSRIKSIATASAIGIGLFAAGYHFIRYQRKISDDIDRNLAQLEILEENAKNPNFSKAIKTVADHLGYEKTSGGWCLGVSLAMINSFFADELDVTIKRLHRFEELSHSELLLMDYNCAPEYKESLYSDWKEDGVTPPEAKDVETLDPEIKTSIRPFIETIYLSQHQESEWFNGKVRGDLKKILPFIVSKKVEASGGLCFAGEWMGFYQGRKLEDYLELLEYQLAKQELSIAFLLSKISHSMSICYDANRKYWVFIDAPSLPPIIVPHAKQLLEYVNLGFELSGNSVCFQTEIICKNTDREATNKFIDDIQKNKKFQSLHNITPTLAKAVTASNMGLIHLAARSDLSLSKVKQLKKNGANINLCLKNEMNLTPLTIAISQANTNMIEWLVTQGVETNELMLEFAKTRGLPAKSIELLSECTRTHKPGSR